MKIIVLVQHTESEHHINNHIGAWLDWNLTERGRAQAFRIGEWLNNAGCDSTWSMYVSPQRRASVLCRLSGKSCGRSTLARATAKQGNGIGSTRRPEERLMIPTIGISRTRNRIASCGIGSSPSIWI